MFGSSCVNGVCQCPFGTATESGICIAVKIVPAGSKCSKSRLCFGISSCENGFCQCPKGMFVKVSA
ncbi:unnamed protein product [Anisakis simplex]|uniref:EB domain-containing protein n=1 Tax=Anisakis simplex TaxID=6269 RepID=A0A0M3JQ30_ANISI|nr:unnamed protein product [Anisakis simplex]